MKDRYAKMGVEELRREEKKLSAKYEDIEEECLKNGLSFSEFQEKSKDTKEGLYFISKYLRLLQDPIVEFGKEWKGDLYTLDEFEKMSRSKMLVDEDGIGFYATETSKSDVEILPSDVLEGLLRDDFTHIIWFNK